MMALGTGTFGVHSLGHRTPFGAINQREFEELGRWVTQTDCLQMVAVEGSTRVPVKNPLLYPMGEGTDRQRGVPGPGESIRCVCICEVNSRHLGVGKCRWTLNQKKQTCFISYAEFITYTNLSLKYTSVFTQTLTVVYAYSQMHCLSKFRECEADVTQCWFLGNCFV